MTYFDICSYAKVNETYESKVNEIKESIIVNGWSGMPILVSEAHGILITGSHRLAALEAIESNFDVDDAVLYEDVAENVDDIIDEWCEENDACVDDIRFDSLGEIFAGTWVEQYKNEIEEW